MIAEKAGFFKEDLMEYKQYFLYDKLLTVWQPMKAGSLSEAGVVWILWKCCHWKAVSDRSISHHN